MGSARQWFTRQKDRYVPEFSKQIVALDKREVRLRGFMLPLEQGARQRHILLPRNRRNAPFACRRRPSTSRAGTQVKAGT